MACSETNQSFHFKYRAVNEAASTGNASWQLLVTSHPISNPFQTPSDQKAIDPVFPALHHHMLLPVSTSLFLPSSFPLFGWICNEPNTESASNVVRKLKYDCCAVCGCLNGTQMPFFNTGRKATAVSSSQKGIYLVFNLLCAVHTSSPTALKQRWCRASLEDTQLMG